MITSAEFSIQYATHYPRVLRWLKRFAATKHTPLDLVEDIAQWSWCRAWEKRTQFEGRNGCTFVSWVYRIAAKRLIESMRPSQYTVRELQVTLERSHDPTHAYEHALDFTTLLTRLNPEELKVITLRLSGKSNAEIAQVLNATESAVKVVVHRALLTVHGLRTSSPHWTPLHKLRGDIGTKKVAAVAA